MFTHSLTESGAVCLLPLLSRRHLMCLPLAVYDEALHRHWIPDDTCRECQKETVGSVSE